MYNAIRGINSEPVKEKEESIQYSKITTLKKDSKNHQVYYKDAAIKVAIYGTIAIIIFVGLRLVTAYLL